MREGRHVGTASARAGLVGNPSDGFGGAVLATPVDAFGATVTVVDAPRTTVRGPARTWDTVSSLTDDVTRAGHEGGDRLVTAAIAQLAAFAGEDRPRPDVDGDRFLLRWRTSIPRSVGLAGSSAIVVATMRALAQRWSLDVDARVLAVLAVEAERSLGITAGLQDRVVQAVGETVLMDFGEDAWGTVGGRRVPEVRRTAPPSPIPLYLAWRPAAAAPSQHYHRSLAERFGDGEAAVVDAVRPLGALAAEAAAAVAAGDHTALGALMDASFAARTAVAPQGAAHLAMVDAARAAGLSATSAGSGGAIVGVLASRAGFERLRSELAPLGCGLRRLLLS